MIEQSKRDIPLKRRRELGALWPIVGLILLLAVAATSWQALASIKEHVRLELSDKLEAVLKSFMFLPAGDGKK